MERPVALDGDADAATRLGEVVPNCPLRSSISRRDLPDIESDLRAVPKRTLSRSAVGTTANGTPYRPSAETASPRGPSRTMPASSRCSTCFAAPPRRWCAATPPPMTRRRPPRHTRRSVLLRDCSGRRVRFARGLVTHDGHGCRSGPIAYSIEVPWSRKRPRIRGAPWFVRGPKGNIAETIHSSVIYAWRRMGNSNASTVKQSTVMAPLPVDGACSIPQFSFVCFAATYRPIPADGVSSCPNSARRKYRLSLVL